MRDGRILQVDAPADLYARPDDAVRRHVRRRRRRPARARRRSTTVVTRHRHAQRSTLPARTGRRSTSCCGPSASGCASTAPVTGVVVRHHLLRPRPADRGRARRRRPRCARAWAPVRAFEPGDRVSVVGHRRRHRLPTPSTASDRAPPTSRSSAPGRPGSAPRCRLAATRPTRSSCSSGPPAPGGLAGELRGRRGARRPRQPSAPPVLPARDPRRAPPRLLGDDLQRRRRHGRIRLAGRWVAFPPNAGDLVRRLPPRLRAAGSRVDALRQPVPPRRARHVRRGRAGRPRPHDGSTSSTRRTCARSGASSPTSSAASSPVAASARGSGARSRPPSCSIVASAPGAGTFSTRAGASGRSPSALADAAAAAGAECASTPRSTRSSSTARAQRSHAGGRTVVAAQVWSTLPLPVLAASLAPPRRHRCSRPRPGSSTAR